MCIRGDQSGKGRGGVLGKGKGTYIRGKEREVISGKGKGTNVTSKEREVYQVQGWNVYQG